jgi:hypothetical protein
MGRWIVIVAAVLAVSLGGITLGVAQEATETQDAGEGGACATPEASPFASPEGMVEAAMEATPEMGMEMGATPDASPTALIECATPEMGGMGETDEMGTPST